MILFHALRAPHPLTRQWLDALDHQLRVMAASRGRLGSGLYRGLELDQIPAFAGIQFICCGDFFQVSKRPGAGFAHITHAGNQELQRNREILNASFLSRVKLTAVPSPAPRPLPRARSRGRTPACADPEQAL